MKTGIGSKLETETGFWKGTCAGRVDYLETIKTRIIESTKVAVMHPSVFSTHLCCVHCKALYRLQQ